VCPIAVTNEGALGGLRAADAPAALPLPSNVGGMIAGAAVSAEGRDSSVPCIMLEEVLS